jgi:stearoyl-CoA desaturase (delta-9 desaturase)
VAHAELETRESVEPAGAAAETARAGRSAPVALERTRLPLPATVRRSQLIWSYVIGLGVIHLLALLVFVPYLFSWTGVVLLLVGIHVYGHGITMCYHRQLTHRSFETPKWLERCFATIALCCLEDTPAKWVCWHRIHHNHSDEPEDPHSPLVNFLWSHFGWLMVNNVGTHDIAAYYKYARDILEDPFYMLLEKRRWLHAAIYGAHALVYFLVGYGVGWAVWGQAVALQFGLSLLVWGAIARTVAVWHITWSVNSVTHTFGYQNYNTGDHSKNNWLVGILAGGEGWHNNHHYDQASACNQHRWWEFDIAWQQVKFLRALGLARNIVPPKHLREAARRAANEA